ncbi:hypothetical protein METBIDRAFT_78679 [Metschnikowia bicuspidata var. bicuspidata NRRL YB-4993]|uniref:HCP-like protein n=1 Tax=Metschnikowia bicuspidata var. bicuspidata NRRL YB-4993 TaxID=869754 RepID=A0A1A0H8L7_9ASCO|nr:hypothetical protein METBIDRAFT_78679 [Metschnikowia bicuspidata var. bicuspidata NRRL YB-4993]OBA20228.1 hypothetical protein METBIDRAFT_78679 [Metschnikowia bicuspidata var. bicuspidata NRRL YB-4993]
MAQLAQLPPKFEGEVPVFSHTNLHRGIHVPQYNLSLHDYESEPPRRVPARVLQPLAQLQQACDMGSAAAAVALADIYTFGNYSVPPDYPRALALYRRGVQTRADGHAYFMMAHFYQTGMFGELAPDRQRARVYYEFAARNGHAGAVLVLAYQHLNGVGCQASCDTAQFYYSSLARQAVQQAHEQWWLVPEDRVAYNVHIADFHGGLYGARISESESSVLSDIDSFVRLRASLKDQSLDALESRLLDVYFDALLHHSAGFFSPQNATQVHHEMLECVDLGRAEHAAGRLENPLALDRQIWRKCQNLLGHMYLAGQGVPRDLAQAHRWLSLALALQPDKENLLDMALLRRLDPTTHGLLSPLCVRYLQDAATNGSSHGVFLYAQNLVAPRSPLETTYVDLTYDLLRTATRRGHPQAMFYFADAVELGFAESKGELFTCPELVLFYKSFVEHAEPVLLPHLSYAFQELAHGNYKNALLGYLIAAEQGLLNSQLSAAYLLYQTEPLFAWKRKTYNATRVQAALRYLDLASSQDHVDSTILLGDLYANGLPGGALAPDHEKAFAYYTAAALYASAHACYKLGYMYEYGLGVPNSSPDYYMAKRYYDLSIKYYQDLDTMLLTLESKPSTSAIKWALLRLRLKFLLSDSEKRDDAESTGWLDTLKNLARSKDIGDLDEKAAARAQAHAEGEAYEQQDDYQIFDYIVLIFTLAFFLYVGFQNLRRQFRRVGQRVNAGHADGANAPRFQVEFFFAI